jgi:glucose/arabinose dehydrogenase
MRVGLLERAPLAAFDLPASTTQFGNYAFARRYPGLSFAEPLYVAPVPALGPSNHLIVAEQRGTIVVFPANPGTPGSRLILDIRSIVEFDGEQGLLGLAFDPDFAATAAESRFVYLHYSAADPRRSVISRFTWTDTSEVIDPTTELVLLEVAQPYPNHNGGMLSFGPD